MLCLIQLPGSYNGRTEHLSSRSSGGLDYTNPDALSAKYPGDFEI